MQLMSRRVGKVAHLGIWQAGRVDGEYMRDRARPRGARTGRVLRQPMLGDVGHGPRYCGSAVWRRGDQRRQGSVACRGARRRHRRRRRGGGSGRHDCCHHPSRDNNRDVARFTSVARKDTDGHGNPRMSPPGVLAALPCWFETRRSHPQASGVGRRRAVGRSEQKRGAKTKTSRPARRTRKYSLVMELESPEIILGLFRPRYGAPCDSAGMCFVPPSAGSLSLRRRRGVGQGEGEERSARDAGA